MTKLGFIAAFVFSTTVFAADPGEASLKRGLAHFSRGEWKPAIKHLTAAATKLRDAKGRARAFKHVGIAQLELGKNSAAEQAFVFALTADPLVDIDPVSDPPPAVALFRTTRDRLEGTLSVSANRPNARVFVDGNDRGPTPFTGSIKVGRHQIRVATPDGHYERLMDNVIVGVGKTVALTLDLEARVGFLVVSGPPGHDVHVDGAPVGRTPLKRAVVAPGKRTVSVMRAGFDTKIAEIEVEAGREARVDGTLVKSAPTAIIRPPILTPSKGAPPTTTTTALTTSATPPLKTVVTSESGRNTRPWAWVTLGVSAVSLAIGSVLYFATSPDSSGARDDVIASVDSANSRVLIGGGLLIGSALVGGASLALFLLHREAKPTRVSFGITVPPLSGGKALGLSIAIRK